MSNYSMSCCMTYKLLDSKLTQRRQLSRAQMAGMCVIWRDSLVLGMNKLQLWLFRLFVKHLPLL
ncbi:hypothetical protein J6590_076294 [Homalodisca vitripennis]|nr:hypothetical protein J6590_076294 [Homalodisca vitripennis]